MLRTHPMHFGRTTGALHDVPPSYAHSRRGTWLAIFWFALGCLQTCSIFVRLLPKGHFLMSRIPAPGAIVATTTISVVLAICMLGGVGTAANAGDSVAPISNGTVGSTLASPGAALMTGGGATQLGGTVTLVDAPTAFSAPASAAASVPASAPAPTITLGLAAGALAAQAAVTNQATILTRVIAAPALLPPVPARPATPLAITGTPSEMAHAVALNAGLSDRQWSCLDQLWQRESKFETTVRNPRSGAYGIPQALPASRMASAGADWRTNPVTQIKWGMSYIDVRYGTACNAWSHWVRYRWY
jgi:hypothetical protein